MQGSLHHVITKQNQQTCDKYVFDYKFPLLTLSKRS